MIISKLAKTTLILNKPNAKVYGILFRNLASDSKPGFFRRSLRSKDVSSGSGAFQGSAPSYTPIAIGQGMLAGASVIGLGTLAYYGLGLSNQAGIIDRTSVWPQFIRDRVSTTYEYFGATLGVTAASAYAVSRNPALMNIVSKNSIMSMVAFLAASIGSQMLVRAIPYESGKVSSKHLAWALHAGIIGAFLAPMTALGGPLLVRAAWYTAGAVGGLSAIAATAPSEKFLNMGGPLAIGFGLVFASSIGTMFLPPTTRMGLSLYSISIYGGLILFSMYLLYDTQRIIKKAEQSMHFDPINESISIYMNTINIFIRMAMILSGNRKK